MRLRVFFTAFFLFIIPSLVFAAFTEDLVLTKDNISFGSSVFLEGRAVRIYAVVGSKSTKDLKGVVRFFDGANGPQIKGDQPVSIVSNKEDTVFIDSEFLPGNHEIIAKLFLFDDANDDPSNNTASRVITVLPDADRDGKPNDADPDDDNDGVADEEDLFPLDRKEWKDTDGDLKGDNADEDDDNDGVKDAEDGMPLDSTETKDTDKDGIGDNADLDDDNDGISDADELKKGLDPLNPDTDGDGVLDGEDLFPLDPKESKDYDKDGIGDNKDIDADNDGILKTADKNDANKGPEIILGGLPAFPLINQKVAFDFSKTNDPDGDVSKIEVKITEPDGALTSLEGKKPAYIFKKQGSYKIVFEAVDDKGEIRSKIINVNVRPPVFYIISVLLILLAISIAIFLIIKYSGMRKKKRKWYQLLFRL